MPQLTLNTARFAYTPRIADILRFIVDKISNEVQETPEDLILLSEVLNVIRFVEQRDKELEDFIAPHIRSRAFRTSTQSIPASTTTVVQYDTVDYDPTGQFGPTTPVSTFTSFAAGWYHVEANAIWAPPGNGVAINNIYEVILKNNVEVARGVWKNHPITTTSTSTPVSDILFLGATDVITTAVFHDSAAATNISANSRFAVHLLSPQVFS